MGHIQNLLKDASSKGAKCAARKPLWKCITAEFIGTAILVFMGCGSIVRLPNDARSLTGISLCWGFTIATLAQTLGGYSCDINPAVSIAELVTGRSSILKCALYIIAQCLGGLGGGYVLTLLMPEEVIGNWGMTKLNHGVSPLQGFFLEMIATFLLVFLVFSSTDERRTDVKGSVPLSIGLCVSGLIFCVGPHTGCSLNPARSLGPAILAGNFEHHWVYWLGPIAGGLVGGLLYHHLYRIKIDKDESSAPTSV